MFRSSNARMTSPPVCSLPRLLCSAQRTKTLEHSSTCFLKPFDLDYMSGLFFWGCPPAKSSAKKVSKRRGSFSCLCAFRTSPRPSHRLHHQNPTAERTMSFPPFLKPTSHEKAIVRFPDVLLSHFRLRSLYINPPMPRFSYPIHSLHPPSAFPKM